MKCIKCGCDKSPSDFAWKKKNVRKSATCKSCHKMYKDAHYVQNRERLRQKAGQRRAEVDRQNRTNMIAYLSNKCCVDCGESDMVVLDFDHRKDEEKCDNVTTLMAHSNSWKTILKEMEKCDIRCSNCHRKATARRFGSYKQFYQDCVAAFGGPLNITVINEENDMKG